MHYEQSKQQRQRIAQTAAATGEKNETKTTITHPNNNALGSKVNKLYTNFGQSLPRYLNCGYFGQLSRHQAPPPSPKNFHHRCGSASHQSPKKKRKKLKPYSQ